MTDDYPVTEQQLGTFGAIVHFFGRHEMLMQVTMAALMHTEFGAVVALTSGMGYAAKRDGLLALLEFVPPDKEHDEKLRWFVGNLHQHARLRNHIAHCGWSSGAKPNSIKPLSVSTRGATVKVLGMSDQDDEYTLADLERIAHALAANYNRWHDFLVESGLFERVEGKLSERVELTNELYPATDTPKPE